MMMHIDIAWKSLNKFGEELCGDKVEIVHAPDSDILVLADGLGSGVKANILSSLTSKIIITMLQEGLAVDEAVDTIAHTLPICKVRQVAYSTFSILQLFHDGRAYLVEYDNPACIFIRNGKLMKIPYEEREIAGKTVRESKFDVALGDMFALVSDGVIFAGVGSILNLGWQWENVADFFLDCAKSRMSVHRVVASVAQTVDTFYQGRPGDDSTFLVAQAVPRKNVHFFSGPPVDKEKDEEIIRDFMRGPSKKIVAGGTSANIAARVLGRKIITNLDFSDPAIPPTAEIRGIDLVTEGVLTINRALEILRKFCEHNGEVDLKELDAKNGGAQMARMLIEDCTDLSMYIGKAINPAHQNPNLPMDLSIKMRLLNELADVMRKMGRRVEVHFY